MTKRRKVLLGAFLATAALVLTTLVVLHLPGVQRWGWEQLTDRIRESTGFRVEADSVRLRLVPARLKLEKLEVRTDRGTLLAVGDLRAAWRWRQLVSVPHRLESISVDGVHVDPDAFEPGEDDGSPAAAPDLWGGFEIGSFRLRNGSAAADAFDVGVAVDSVEIRGVLLGGSAALSVSADRLALDRSGRTLDAGPMALEVEAGAEAVDLSRFELGGRTTFLSAQGRLTTAADLEGEIPVRLEADLEEVAAWWDPNLATGLSPGGRIELDGVLTLVPGRFPSIVLEHRGAPFSIAGYGVDTLEIELADGQPRLSAAGSEWGLVNVALGAEGSAEVEARLRNASVDPFLVYAVPRAAGFLGEPVTLSGELDATLSFPIDPTTLAVRVDVEARWPDGRVVVLGEGAGSVWRIRRLQAAAAGLELHARGDLQQDSRLRVELSVGAENPEATAASVARWLPGLEAFEFGGGPAALKATVEGSLDDPAVTAEATWSKPRIGGRSFDAARVFAEGGLAELRWDASLEVIGETRLEAGGLALPAARELDGRWRAELPELSMLLEYLDMGLDQRLDGRLSAEGEFGWADGRYVLGGRARGSDLTAGPIEVPSASLEFKVTPDALEVNDLRARWLGGEVSVEVGLTPVSLEGTLDGRASWRGLDPDEIVPELPQVLSGRVSGEMDLSGSIGMPSGELILEWQPVEADAPLEKMRARARLAGGSLAATAEAVTREAGSAAVEAEIPLGGLVRPPWLWPDAPGGLIVAEAGVSDFHSSPITDFVEFETADLDLVTDLQLSVAWDPTKNRPAMIEVQAEGLRVLHPTGELAADGPVEVRVDGRAVRVAPVVLSGFDSRIEVEADYDLADGSVQGHLNSLISEKLTRLIPLPVRVRGPLAVDAELRLPVTLDEGLGTARGRFSVDHGDGVIVMRDPPLEIRGMRISGAFEGSRIDIDDGRAEVNRGDVVVGGGWDPEHGQGVVLELDDVMLFTEGILSQWDGDLAIEPSSEGLVHVAGDLTLEAGLWDETFNIASAFRSGGSFELASDDPLHQISLDLTVRGRSGVRVDNNLGRFDVSWDVLRADGTAASPRLRGGLRIAPGGVLTLGGQEVRVRRGVLEFTGDPSVDPIVEIVPESDLMLIGDDEGSVSWDPTLMATRGLAQGLSSALGFENETLRPAEIAVETERDPSVNFMVGQRLHRNLALFLTTNLTDVQDRVTMLQGWNFRGVPGLVVQLYQETIDGNFGGNLLQRFSWGGPQELKRPEIHRLRLEGEWPMSKRYLKRSTRLRRGQPYDPFLLFVASVRMERTLAKNGFQNARVTGFQEGDRRSPTLVFYCDPGSPQFVHFHGDQPSRPVRAELTAMYRPPPLEDSSLEAMRTVLTRYLALDGFPDAEITVERRGDLVVVDVDQGPEVALLGPFFDGLAPEIADAVGPMIGSARVIAAMARRPERVERTVEQRLASLGYLEASVTAVDVLRRDESTAEVRLTVEPGPRQAIGAVELIGGDPMGLFDAPSFGVAPGQPLDRAAVESATRALRNTYIEAGYRHASARSELRYDEVDGWVVEITLEPGSIRRLRQVSFEGLNHVSKRVLSKGMSLAPGEVVTDLEIDRTASKMANFSPVERVEVRPVEVGVSEVDLEFDVVEKKRWAADLGGGWSTERGLSTSFGIRDENLFGRGLGLNLRGGWGSTEKRLFLLGSLPPVPGGRLTLISTLGYTDGDAPDEPDLLQQEEKLASLEAQYALASRLQVGLYYRWTDTRTFEKEPDPFFPLDIRVRQGTVGTRVVMDRFDFLFDPRKGYGLTTDLGWSSNVFGSDLDYLSWLSNFSLALTPFEGATWLQTARLGVAEPLKGQELVRDSRFFAGGQASIRGFDLNSVGPVTFGIGGTLVPAGGGALFVLNEELRIPVWGPIRAAVFADIGQVWESWSEADTAFSVGVGVGVRWSTPIGPLWADVAWPVANVGISSKKAKFYLGIGRPF